MTDDDHQHDDDGGAKIQISVCARDVFRIR